MHSVLPDHYTQCPFDNSFHQRESCGPYQASNLNVKGCVATSPKEPPKRSVSSLPGQSVLTWSPGQVLMTSPLLNWTPYLATMATNPTAKYSLDLQLSCTRSDSGFEDTTTPSPANVEENTTSPEKPQFGSTTSSTIGGLSPEKLPSRSNEAKLPDLALLGKPILSSVQSEHVSTIGDIRPNRTKRATPKTDKPAPPKASRPSSNPDQGIDFRSSLINEFNGSISLASDSDKPRHRLSTRSVDRQFRTSRPASSRRSSTFPAQRTTSRTGSFILSRNEPRPIDFSSVVQRTREQQESENKVSAVLHTPEDVQTESECPSPEPQHIQDHPIHWTSPDSRAAQYAKIDGKKKGIKGVWRRVRRRLKLGKREIDFYDGGSDAGSVRRYRLDTYHEKLIER